MKVRVIKGKAKPQYTLFYPADKDISELPEQVQLGVKALGEIFSSEVRDLTHATDFTSREILEKIQSEGA
jgi:hypothetical protein